MGMTLLNPTLRGNSTDLPITPTNLVNNNFANIWQTPVVTSPTFGTQPYNNLTGKHWTGSQQLARRGSESSLSSGDSGTPIDFDEGAGEGHYYITEPGSYKTTTTTTVMGNAPFGSMVHGATTRTSTGPVVTEPVETTETQEETVSADGEVVSSQTISSKTRTVETITYKTERNGVIETRVEQKITIQSDGDPIDHDRALAEAIQEATAMNPDMTVEKIEIQQQSTQP